MSEEEIIKDLEKYIELINKEYCDECNELNAISGKYCNGSRNVALAIQGLLDLYNKEKEKNKQWEDKIKAKIEEIDRRIDNLDKELTEAYIAREKLGTETEIDYNEQYIYNMEQEKSVRHTQKRAYQELLEEKEI